MSIKISKLYNYILLNFNLINNINMNILNKRILILLILLNVINLINFNTIICQDLELDSITDNTELFILNQNNVDSIDAEIENLIQYSQNMENQVDILFNLAKSYKNSNIQKSIIILNKSMVFINKIEDENKKYLYYLELVKNQLEINNFKKSLEILNKVKNSINKNEKQIVIKQSINNELYKLYGILCLKTNNLGEAEEFFNLSIENSLKSKDSLLITDQLNYLGQIYKIQKKYNKALDMFDISIQLLNRNSEFEKIGDNYLSKAETFFELKDIIKSIANYNIAKDYYLKTENKNKQADIFINIGFVLFKFADYYKSIAHLKKGISIADEIKNQTIKKTGLNYLHLVYFKAGDFRKAYETLEDYNKINEDISINNFNKTISEMQIKLNLDKNSNLQKNKEEFNITLYILLGLIIILISLLSYITFNYLKLKKDINKNSKI